MTDHSISRFYNDLLALGVMDVARELGIAILLMCLVGYNDMPFVIVQPPLTTIHIPVAEMGRQAAQVLMEKD